MEGVRRVERPVFAELRGERPFAAAFDALWCEGSLDGLRRPCVAIVGTRAATAYGRAAARRFARTLGEAGCCILSGLALGIDAAAHEGALEAAAPTLGVLGGGHAKFFPRRNRGLAERMLAAGGAVLSPFPPEEASYPGRFLERNGVVAALADAVLVVEAPARSGALNTASWAAGEIPVLAVPGDVDRPSFAGSHALIRDGAVLARSPQDVLRELRLPAPCEPPVVRAESGAGVDSLQQAILGALRGGERGFDELLADVKADAAGLTAAFAMLEIAGRVESRPGLRYALTRAAETRR